jgi:hypothetical protein
MEQTRWLEKMLHAVDAEQAAFVAARSEAELANLGELETWSSTSPKAIISHCDMWNKKLLENCRAALRGQTPTPFSDGARNNDLEYTKQRAAPLADVLADAQQTLSSFLELVQQTDAALWVDTHLFAGQTRPLWRTLPGVLLVHPVLHYVIFDAANGATDRAAATSQRLFDLTQNMGGTDTRGVAFYNLACCSAKLGQLETAIRHLAQAASFQPHLLESARHDPHLSKLHGLPAFETLYTEKAK